MHLRVLCCMTLMITWWIADGSLKCWQGLGHRILTSNWSSNLEQHVWLRSNWSNTYGWGATFDVLSCNSFPRPVYELLLRRTEHKHMNCHAYNVFLLRRATESRSYCQAVVFFLTGHWADSIGALGVCRCRGSLHRSISSLVHDQRRKQSCWHEMVFTVCTHAAQVPSKWEETRIKRKKKQEEPLEAWISLKTKRKQEEARIIYANVVKMLWLHHRARGSIARREVQRYPQVSVPSASKRFG